MTAPIVGATEFTHLEGALGALAVGLPPAGVAYLEALYAPHPVGGHR